MNMHNTLQKDQFHSITLNMLIDCKTEWMVKILLFCVLLQAMIFRLIIFQVTHI